MSSSGPPSSSSSQRRGGRPSVASGEPRRSPGLVGREAELAAIADLVERAGAGSTGALLVTGEPGIGKSALLQRAAEEARADGVTTLRTRGVEADAGLGYAGLLTLLAPLRPFLEGVPGPQAEAVARAAGWSAGPPPEPLLVGGGTLALLSAAAASAPLLVVVDDAHWLDAESSTAVLFALRRMRDDAVAFLGASRTPVLPGWDELPAIGLGGLAPEAVRRGWPGVVAPVAERLAAAAEGNPLVLEGLVPSLSAAQRAGAAPLPPVPAVGPALVAALGERTAGLSPAARRLALLHACAGPGEEDLVPLAAARDGIDPGAALEEAVAARVLVAGDAGARPAHPLLRGVLLDGAAPAVRREAHASLARAADQQGRRVAAARHRAEAAVGPDQALAAELASVADAGLAGSRAAASVLLERATALSGDAGAAAALRARAVEEAFLAGDLDRTRRLADRLLADGPPGPVRAQVLALLGAVEESAGSVPRAAVLLADAARQLEGAEPPGPPGPPEPAERLPLVRVLASLAQVRFRLGDVAGYAECAARLAAAAAPADDYQRMLARFAEGWAAALSGDTDRAAPALTESLALATSRPVTDMQTLCVYQAAVFAPELHGLVTTGTVRADELRRSGAALLLVPALTMLAHLRVAVGDHRGAFADAGEAVELAGLLGHVADAATAHELLAWQSAARGLHEDAAASLGRAAGLLERAGLTAAAAHHALTAAFCALSRGDLEEVVRVLEPRIDLDGGAGSFGEPMGVAPMLVEALVGLGRRQEAQQVAARLDAVVPPGAPPVLEAPRLRCRALVATDPDEADGAFRAATRAYTAAPDVVEALRTQLLHGSWLRRTGRRSEARAVLAAAEDGFARLDLTAWAGTAGAERAATGERARPRGEPTPTEPLTSQETRVALLVAEGLSNKEVAARLFLSPRTVETHLTAVFRKRGYRSRTALAADLGRAGDGGA